MVQRILEYPVQARDLVHVLVVVNPEAHQDLGLVHVDLDLKVPHVVVQDLDRIQVVDLDLVAVLILAVDLDQEVVLLHVVVQDLIADLGLALHLVLNRVHNLVVNLSQYQDHQHDQSLVVVLLLIHQLAQEVDLYLIHAPNLVADLLLDLGADQVLDPVQLLLLHN